MLEGGGVKRRREETRVGVHIRVAVEAAVEVGWRELEEGLDCESGADVVYCPGPH